MRACIPVCLWACGWQLEGDERLQSSLVEELRKALVQSLEIELDFMKQERDGAAARADGLQRQLVELPTLREEVRRLREQLALSQGTVEALRSEQATLQAALKQQEEATAARIAEAAKAAAVAGVAKPAGGSSPVPGTSDALVPVGGSRMSRRSSIDTADVDQEFMNADTDHDGEGRCWLCGCCAFLPPRDVVQRKRVRHVRGSVSTVSQARFLGRSGGSGPGKSAR